jgi:hypothetical protein
MHFLPISDNAARQSIDAANIWAEYLHAQAAAQPYAGGMYWKKEGSYEYLVKTHAGNKQQRLGPRTSETEHVFASFHTRKKATEARLSSLAEALDEAQRQNKALRAGRTPEIVVKLLNALREAGLDRHFRVVGTHALYAYESAAGVRIVQGALATQDVDLLWDARRRLQFLVDLQRDARSVLAVLQRVDRSFQRRDDALKNESAMNDKGFEVEFLRRENEPGDIHPFRFSDNEGDLWPVQARRATVLAQSPLFSQPVISATGKMATMHTIDPRTFVEFKRWMANQDGRDPVKRRRDALQADIVQEMLQTKMLTSAIDERQ